MDDLENIANHPLQGQYIVMSYRECDTEAEGSGLAIYRMQKTELEVILSPALEFHPYQYDLEYLEDPVTGESVTPREYGVGMLKKMKISEVVTIIMNGEFFGIPDGCHDHDEEVDEDSPCVNWSEFTTIFDDTEEYFALKRGDIELKLFDERTRKYVD